ncbi:helix-turn-helix domain-containing protein [Actinomadura rugatobispora]|uniref:Helix-turn-helix domain-containing protein n=1 Tax=Actinomadura rugatobispora TaxID=1994 RepID=A0ABW1A5M3_9ACTN|nr:helix-turn-helix transcriptional regulator [Actinomadura rugatobispora]
MTAAEALDPDESLWHALSFQLRHERQKRGLSQTATGDIMGVNKHAVSNYEAGRNRMTLVQAVRLDRAWDTGGLFARLRRFAKAVYDPEWGKKVERNQREAEQHKIFQNNVVPLPFQIEGYARSLLAAGQAAGAVDDLDGAVQRRMDHQEAILERRPKPPLVWAVLDELALRQMAPSEVMRAQYEHLIKLSELQHVSLRVLPATATPNIGVDGSFWFFDLPGRQVAAFAGTTLNVGRLIDDQAEAATAAVRFDHLAARVLNEEQSRELLARRIEET